MVEQLLALLLCSNTLLCFKCGQVFILKGFGYILWVNLLSPTIKNSTFPVLMCAW